MRLLILALSLSSTLILSACTGTTTTVPVNKASFTCSDNQVYSVSIFRDKNDAELLELTLPGGKNATLINVVAASGARYVGATYEWWEKGNDVTFSNLNTTLECRRVQN